MHSDAFKRKLVFSIIVIILALNNFLATIIKSFITETLEYKPILKLKK